MTAKVHIMQHEKDPLNLGSLPLVLSPPDDWPTIEAALQNRNNRRRFTRLAGSTLAIAATAVLAVSVLIYQPFGISGAPSEGEWLQTTQVEEPAANEPSRTDTLDSLIALSQELESNLRKIRAQAGVMTTSAVIYQVELEDLVAQVDDELSMRPDSIDLWSQRINLMMDLSQLFQNELRREYLRMASL
jgi:hypothetical protein